MRFVLVMLLACACARPVTSARPDEAPSACVAGAPTSGYDSWPSGERCEELDELWRTLPAAARSCTHDQDCSLVTGPCFVEALRRDVIEGGYSESPCAHPVGGMCAPSAAQRAECVGGCCVPAP